MPLAGASCWYEWDAFFTLARRASEWHSRTAIHEDVETVAPEIQYPNFFAFENLMAESRLANAVLQLRSAYGSPEPIESPNQWATFLRVLLTGPGRGESQELVRAVLASPPLDSAGALSKASTGQLVERLSAIPRGAQKASLIRAVAEWWLAQFGDQADGAWTKDLQFYRESLRRIKGLGPATVDELLLFVAKLPVFPVSRGAMRVAVRHGWLDLPLEDSEAQDVFVRGLADSPVELGAAFQLLSQVAEAHCGREPQCDGCPLQPLLPPNGPLNPDSC